MAGSRPASWPGRQVCHTNNKICINIWLKKKKNKGLWAQSVPCPCVACYLSRVFSKGGGLHKNSIAFPPIYAFMPVHHLHAWCPRRSRENIRVPDLELHVLVSSYVDEGN